MQLPNISFRTEDQPPKPYCMVKLLLAYDNTTGVRMGGIIHELHGDSVMITSLVVDPSAHRQGLGKMLLRKLSSQHPKARLRLILSEYDDHMLATMLLLGFTIKSRYLGLIDDALNVRVYPPMEPKGWVLEYERGRVAVDYSARHKALADYLHAGFEEDIYLD